MTSSLIEERAKEITDAFAGTLESTGENTADKPNPFMYVLGLYDLIFSQWFRKDRGHDPSGQCVAFAVQSVLFNFIVSGIARDGYFDTLPQTLLVVLVVSTASYFSAEGIRTWNEGNSDSARSRRLARSADELTKLIHTIRDELTFDQFAQVAVTADTMFERRGLGPFTRHRLSGLQGLNRRLGQPDRRLEGKDGLVFFKYDNAMGFQGLRVLVMARIHEDPTPWTAPFDLIIFNPDHPDVDAFLRSAPDINVRKGMNKEMTAFVADRLAHRPEMLFLG